MTREVGGAIAGHSPDYRDQPRQSIVKAESDTAPLESIPPSIAEENLDIESQHDQDLESQHDDPPNSETLRGHARQMKQLGKRLASPDRALVKRMRRDVRYFANLTDQKEHEMTLERGAMHSRSSSSSGYDPQTSGNIDLFGRYKML
jgi:hypothetical protein